MLFDSPVLRTGLSLPAGDGAFIQIESGHNSLHRAAIGQQRQYRNHQPPWLVYPVERGVCGLREGMRASFALVAAFFSTMDHDVAFALTTVGAAASVVAPFAVRVHADTPLVGVQRPNKDAPGPACSSTQHSSTVPWGATGCRHPFRKPLQIIVMSVIGVISLYLKGFH